MSIETCLECRVSGGHTVECLTGPGFPETAKQLTYLKTQISRLHTTLCETEKTLVHLTGQNDSLIERLDEAERKLGECQVREAEAREIARIYRGLKHEYPCGCEDCQKLQDRHMALINLSPISRVFIPKTEPNKGGKPPNPQPDMATINPDELYALRELSAVANGYVLCHALSCGCSLCQALANLDRVKEAQND